MQGISPNLLIIPLAEALQLVILMALELDQHGWQLLLTLFQEH